VEHGANVNYYCNGIPVLTYACGQGKTKIVTYLLDKGADAALRDKHNNTALHLAACEGNFHEIIEALLSKLNNVNEKNGKGRSPLYLACDRATNEKSVEALLKFGADVNATSPKGATALHVACHRGSLPTCKVLLKNGADCSVFTNDGKLPIQFGVELGSKDVVALLLKETKFGDIGYLLSLVTLSTALQKRKTHLSNAQITTMIQERIAELQKNRNTIL